MFYSHFSEHQLQRTYILGGATVDALIFEQMNKLRNETNVYT